MVGRHPASVAVRRSSTISKKNVSEACGPILIKSNLNHHWVWGLIALGFGAVCIKIVVSMATNRSHRLAIGKTKKISFSESTRPRASLVCMSQCLVVPIIMKLCQSWPWGQIWPRPGDR